MTRDYVDVFNCNPFNQTIGNASTYRACNITLCDGYSVAAGVCLNGGSYTGDTVISLYNSSGYLMALNDDSDLCGPKAVGSELSYTPASGTACDSYELRQYCYDLTSCSGITTVVISPVTSSVPTSKDNTSLSDMICLKS